MVEFVVAYVLEQSSDSKLPYMDPVLVLVGVGLGLGLPVTSPRTQTCACTTTCTPCIVRACKFMILPTRANTCDCVYMY